ncbi:MAG: HDOD domain-containing protein [Gammaproteobacteria bacterium]|nr:HDOD domain-containing protein [Gammaproteobacteria bacterium]NIV20726.1 HDOD domain-containing protein [Gammaproteobacteria bacterium]NIY32356.1 HDOD domain-containing protein [Gammaproteobacteria bacterium]
MEPNIAAGPPKSLEHWVKQLCNKEMPALAHTARMIAGEAARGESSVTELARLILQDASMTTRLLRMANSSYYNASRNSINTVSRAIVVLGFETVRNICLSIAIIDSFVEGANKARVVGEMARSFHAAVQARTLAQHRGDRSPEEVFIATLLLHLGRMAFWCFADDVDPDAATRLNRTLEDTKRPLAEAEREALGFSLAELSAALNREWRLSSLLGQALGQGVDHEARTMNIALGRELAEAAEDGWDTPEVKELLIRAAESLYMPVDKATRLIHNNARDAAVAMSNLGAGKASGLIPVPRDLAAEGPGQGESGDEAERSRFPKADRELQLHILRQLSQLLVDESPDLNLLLEMVLEGIYRGVGMDRTVFALVSPERTALRAKHALGWDRQQLMRQFRFQLSDPPRNVLDYVIQQRTALWVPQEPEAPVRNLITDELRQVTGNAAFFAMPLSIHGKAIGVLHADRRPSGRELDADDFESFRLFGQQAQLGLSHLTA